MAEVEKLRLRGGERIGINWQASCWQPLAGLPLNSDQTATRLDPRLAAIEDEKNIFIILILFLMSLPRTASNSIMSRGFGVLNN